MTNTTVPAPAPKAATARTRKILLLAVTVCLVAGSAFVYHVHTLSGADERAQRGVAAIRARSLALEAALCVRYGNYTVAYERTGQVLESATKLGLAVDKEVADIKQNLLYQKPDAEIALALLRLADKFEAPAQLGPKDPNRKTSPATHELLFPAGQTAALGFTAKPAPPAVANPGANPVASPGANPPAVSAGTPQVLPNQNRNIKPETLREEGRQTLGQAKVLLLSGKNTAGVLEQVARAQVLLDESGKNDASGSILSALAALKTGDEKAALGAIDAALTSLR